MERLTTNKPVAEMGMSELAHNGCYIDEDGNTRYRDFKTDVDARELTRNIMRWMEIWGMGDDEMLSNEVFDDTIMEYLMYGTNEYEGVVALFYRNLWAMAELREKLKAYEDAEEQGLLFRLPCKAGDIVYYINFSQGKVEEDIVMEYLLETFDWYVRLRRSKWVHLDIFKTRFYLTKEEAEQKLAEMKKE